MEEASYRVWEWLAEFRREAERRSVFSGTTRMHELLGAIRAAGAADATPGLISTFPRLPRGLRKRAATVVEHLVASLPAESIVALAQWARGGWPRATYERDVRLWVNGPDANETAVRAVLTCHPNGYMREAALQRLRGAAAGYVSAFALLRLNDWVPQVRAEAAELIRERIEMGRGEEWGPWIPVLHRVARAVRADQETLVRRIESIVGKTEAVLEALDAGDREVRRYAFTLALPRAEALERGLRSADPIIRLRSAEAATLDDPQRIETLGNDPYTPIRKFVLKAHPERASRCLFDRARSVRTLARTLLDSDAAPIYRTAVDGEGADLLPAWRGLAECGDDSDAGRFTGALAHTRAAIRAAALVGLADVSAEPPLDEAWCAMEDGAARVRRAAVKILARQPLSLDGTRVRNLLDSVREPRRIRQACALAMALPKWVAGRVLLEATRTVHTELALAYYREWLDRFNRSFERPNAAQAEAFRSALDAAALDDPARSTTHHILRSLGCDA